MLKHLPFLFQTTHLRIARYQFFVLLLGLMGWGTNRTLAAAPEYFQQKLNYRIQVSLDPVHHVLHGRLSMDYTNQ